MSNQEQSTPETARMDSLAVAESSLGQVLGLIHRVCRAGRTRGRSEVQAALRKAATLLETARKARTTSSSRSSSGGPELTAARRHGRRAGDRGGDCGGGGRDVQSPLSAGFRAAGGHAGAASQRLGPGGPYANLPIAQDPVKIPLV